MLVDVVHSSDGRRSGRVRQVVHDFGLADSVFAFERRGLEVPGVDEGWSVGCIVGPSGSGKSLVARAAFGEFCALEGRWPVSKAVIDALGAGSLLQRVSALTAVGLGSVPCWVRPAGSLSVGERYRAALARELLGERRLLVVDEFSSALDRSTAKFASCSLARAVRRDGGLRKLVCVTCHNDVCDWLEADWVLDMASGALLRGRLRRPEIRLEWSRCKCELWRWFKDHHYLNGEINRSSRCYCATLEGEPVGFVALLRSVCVRPIRRVSRLVVRPEFQGCGIGTALLNAVAEENFVEGFATTISAVHPAVECWLRKSDRWKIWGARNTGYDWRSFARNEGVAVREAGRAIVRAEYVGDAGALRASDAHPPRERKRIFSACG